MRLRLALFGALIAIVLTGCGSAGSDSVRHGAATRDDSTPSTGPAKRHRRHHHRAAQPKPKHHEHRKRHHASTGLAAACPAPSRTLSGVYHPSRLEVLDPCRYAGGVVMDVRHEEDGDLHVIVRLDRTYRRLLTAAASSAGRCATICRPSSSWTPWGWPSPRAAARAPASWRIAMTARRAGPGPEQAAPSLRLIGAPIIGTRLAASLVDA
jgi:hypothetical protein